MKQEEAKEIINKFGLIPGKIGRKILLAIENNNWINYEDLPEVVTKHQIEKLKSVYQQKLNEIGNFTYPRNLIFYHVIKDKYPEFSWNISSNNFDDKIPAAIEIKSPRVNNLRPSLLSLLLDRVSAEKDTLLHRKYKCVDKIPINLAKAISVVMKKIEVIYPDEQDMQLFVNWLIVGLNGHELTIFSPVCPDYSVEPTGDPKCPYRHTFNELGEGLGLIAKRILTAVPILINALESFGLTIKIIIGIGDFEANSQANLKRLGITKDEFLNRVAKSKKALKEDAHHFMDIRMITDMLGGQDAWLIAYDEFINRFSQSNFGASDLNYEKLMKIVEKRKNLYDRWYGEKPLSGHLTQLLNQGAEYAVMGSLILRSMKNCLVLGADNDAMSSFYSIEKKIPTLYLKRFYC